MAEIYYFTGAGNSLFVARELERRLPGSILTPMVSLLDNDVIETSRGAVGFVFPSHGMVSPIPVRRFLERLDPRPAGYLFAVVTRGGSRFLDFGRIDRMLARRGRRLDARFLVNMASSDPKLEDWEVPSEDELARIEARVIEALGPMARVIAERRTSRGEDTGYLYPSGFFLNHLVMLGVRYAELSGVKDYFYSDENCRGCGTCEKVCPSGKVRMVEGRPRWSDDVKCFLCYACLNYCPAHASQIKDKWYMKSHTRRNGRYPHPYATADDIAAQKTRDG